MCGLQQPLLRDGDDDGNDAGDDGHNAGTCTEEGGECRALHILALVGLYVDEVVLLHVEGWALEDVGVGQVEFVAHALSVLLAVEGHVASESLVADIAALREHVEDGVALGVEGNDMRLLDGTHNSYAGVEQAHGHIGVLDDVLARDGILDGYGSLVAGHAAYVHHADDGQLHVAVVIDGVAVDRTHRARSAIAHVGSVADAGAEGDVLIEYFQEFGVVAGHLDEDLVGRLQVHLVLLQDLLGLLEHILRALEVDDFLGTHAGGEADDSSDGYGQ